MPTRLYGAFNVSIRMGVTGTEVAQVQVGDRPAKLVESIEGAPWPCGKQSSRRPQEDPEEEREEPQPMEASCSECLQLMPLLNPPPGKTLKLTLGHKARLTVTDTEGKRYEFKDTEEFTLPPNVAQVGMTCEGTPSETE